ncbi:hypothetical protein [Frigoribacterium sp. R86507]|uniref:hypothetical protein n=1 Tax=Frigoribacterium sp. R86507 TaxID=3093850 RepID=UPI0037C857C8
MKKFNISLAVAAITFGALALPAGAASAADLGGWQEGSGAYSTAPSELSVSEVAPFASVRHTGQAEEKVVSGTTNKRAKGWTTWVGVYHYTTAQMERSGSVATSSGRQWGTNGTQAISPWLKATPNLGKGSARTYYGR